MGGTKIEAAAIDSEGKIHFRERISTPGDYHSLVRAIAELGRTVANQTGAPMRLGAPVRLANDANCFALSEAQGGAGAGASSVFGVILGTGCGGGVVIEGKLVNGANGIAGEWGHMPLPWQTPEEYPGAQCWCGRLGCQEIWLSGTGLEADYARLSGKEIDGKEIAALAAQGDAIAQKTLDRLSDRLARALSVIAMAWDPEVIVLGGGVSNIESIYTPTAAALERYAFSDCYKARIVKNKFGDSSGVRGAAWLWRD